MADVVHLHIGVPKSGTTFLQTRMWRNRGTLAEQGLLYPGRLRMDHFHGTQVVRGLAGPGDPSWTSWHDVLAEIEAWDGDAVVSHEFFCIADADQARSLLESLPAREVRVVLTARDYVRQFPAVWQEALKMGTTSRLREYMDRTLQRRGGSRPWGWDSQDLPAIVDRWALAAESSGRTRPTLQLVTVPPAGAPHDLLWQRWREVVPFDDSAFEHEVNRPNQSLGAAQAALLTYVEPHVSGVLEEAPERHRWLRHYLGHGVLQPQGGDRIGLSASHRAQLVQLSSTAVEQLRTRDLRVVGSLDELVSPSEARDGERSPDDVGADELLDVAGRTLEQMVRDFRQVSLERDEWRRQALAVPPPRRHLAVRATRALARRLRRQP